MFDAFFTPGLGRSVVIFFHLLALAGAAMAIFMGDYALLAQQRVNRDLLAKSARYTTLALVALWITGIAVIALDVASQGAAVLSSEKLHAKITVVVAMRINGWFLHHLVFDSFGLPSSTPHRDAQVAAALGAVSAASWLCAMFIGVAKPWTSVLGYWGFVAGYLAVVAVAVGVALMFVARRLAERVPPVETVPASEDIRLALAQVMGPMASIFIREDVGLAQSDIDSAPVEAVTRIASAIGHNDGFLVRGPGMTRHLFEVAAAAALAKRGLAYHSYAAA